MKLKLSPFEGLGLFSASAHKPSCDERRKPGHFASSSIESAHGLRHFLKLHPRSAGYAAFVAMVLACIAAAATVASNDHLPLMLGSL